MIKTLCSFSLHDYNGSFNDEVTFMQFKEGVELPYSPQSLSQVEVLITRQGAVNSLLDHLPNLKWIQILNAGFERVDLAKIKERGLAFTNARRVYCDTMAEDIVTKILVLSKNYWTHFSNQLNSFWPDDAQLGNFNIDISNKVIGFLGAGAIAKQTALRLRAFGPQIIGYDPYISAQEGFDAIYGDLRKVLNLSDFVVVSLPVTKETYNIIDRESLVSMKKGAFLINIARGEVIDEEALIQALKDGGIRGAAIDVAKEEPMGKGNPLWDAPNLIVTPHRAAYGDLMRPRMWQLIYDNLRLYIDKKTLLDLVII